MKNQVCPFSNKRTLEISRTVPLLHDFMSTVQYNYISRTVPLLHDFMSILFNITIFQDSTLMLTPLKNNEFQVSTTNQFSFLPYHQNLINFNNNNNNNNNNNKQQPFTRSNKLRQNFGKKAGSRPKSVDFEVLKSVENICRAQPTAYGPPGVDSGTGSDNIPQLRASQRLKDRLVGEWQNVRASRV